MNENQTRLFVRQLKKAMEERRITQSELAKISTVSTAAISRLLSGDTKSTTVETADKLAEVFGKTASEWSSGGIAIREPLACRTVLQSDCTLIIQRLVSGVWDLVSLNIPGFSGNACGIFTELAKLDLPEVGWVLCQRAMCRACGELLFYVPSKHRQQVGEAAASVALAIGETLELAQVVIDQDTLRWPNQFASQFANLMQARLQARLVSAGMNELAASQIAGNLPDYFVERFPAEYQQHREQYNRLFDNLQTPFDEAARQSRQWIAAANRFRKQLRQPLFEEAFSLLDGDPPLYIPLRGYQSEIQTVAQPQTPGRKQRVQPTEDELADMPEFAESIDPSEQRTSPGQRRIRRVVHVQEALTHWLETLWPNYKPERALMFLTGGAGSGKSTEARMFALAQQRHVLDQGRSALRVLFVPLHQFSFEGTLAAALDEFCDSHAPPLPNGLLSSKWEGPLLLIFDGLDELAKAGDVGFNAARDFVDAMTRWIQQHCQSGAQRRVAVLFCGRPISVDHAASRDQADRVMHLLPYFVPEAEAKKFEAGSELLLGEQADQRPLWWQRFRQLKGDPQAAQGVPAELKKHEKELADITTQPLLNYLVALSREQGFNFNGAFNRSTLYQYLLDKVVLRPYEAHRHAATGGPRPLEPQEIKELLEDIAVAAWHQGGREVTEAAVTKRLTTRQQQRLQELANTLESGLMRLFLAFYLELRSDTQQRAFEFTHKSFGEYLTARRLIRELLFLLDEHNRFRKEQRGGKDLEEVLVEWAKLFGPTRLTPDLHAFLIAELQATENGQPKYPMGQLTHYELETPRTATEKPRAREDVPLGLRELLNALINRVLQEGLPMQRIEGLKSFQVANNHAIAAEEALLALHCAVNQAAYAAGAWGVLGRDDQGRVVDRLPFDVDWPDRTALGTWLARLTGMREHGAQPVAVRSLRFLPLKQSGNGLMLRGANLDSANLDGADLGGADLSWANLGRANLGRANLDRANLDGADLGRANLNGANLGGANLNEANLEGANLFGAYLDGANLYGAHLSSANLEGANLRYATIDLVALSKTVGRPAYLPDGTQPQDDNWRTTYCKRPL